jgi:hypothetical protein
LTTSIDHSVGGSFWASRASRSATIRFEPPSSHPLRSATATRWGSLRRATRLGTCLARTPSKPEQDHTRTSNLISTNVVNFDYKCSLLSTAVRDIGRRRAAGLDFKRHHVRGRRTPSDANCGPIRRPARPFCARWTTRRQERPPWISMVSKGGVGLQRLDGGAPRRPSLTNPKRYCRNAGADASK